MKDSLDVLIKFQNTKVVIKMNFRTYIYIVSILLSTFAVSGINFDNVFRKNKVIEARVLVVLLALALGYLVGTFVITFIECSKII